eukprot:14446.XXX_431477_431677_1 [CDS] Oithona nana genome sequencing.
MPGLLLNFSKSFECFPFVVKLGKSMFDLGFVSLEHSLELTRSEFGRLKSLMEHLVSDVNTIFEIFS